MTNLEVASCFVDNAIAYAESGDIKTVIVNLKSIKQWLQDPDAENTEYDWEDFK